MRGVVNLSALLDRVYLVEGAHEEADEAMLHETLLEGVPPLPEPPDRLAQVGLRVRRHRGRTVGAAALAEELGCDFVDRMIELSFVFRYPDRPPLAVRFDQGCQTMVTGERFRRVPAGRAQVCGCSAARTRSVSAKPGSVTSAADVIWNVPPRVCGSQPARRPRSTSGLSSMRWAMAWKVAPCVEGANRFTAGLDDEVPTVARTCASCAPRLRR